ncbi:MAG TPA: hypothetical protein DCX53_03850 [Anaerolineae bacterium]|nr:hypothetical protein [Anaerolineae bacterium]
MKYPYNFDKQFAKLGRSEYRSQYFLAIIPDVENDHKYLILQDGSADWFLEKAEQELTLKQIR